MSLFTSEVFWATVIGAVVGGLFTVVGGYFGSQVIVRRERQREHRELVGAIQLARTEMAGNMALIDFIIQDPKSRHRHRLSEGSYRAIEYVLAAGLPLPLFAWISSVFNQVRTLNALVAGESNLSKDDIEMLTESKVRLRGANALLRDYLTKVLKVDLGDIPLQPGAGSEEIEKGVRKKIFGE
jgi:hypothetical protein